MLVIHQSRLVSRNNYTTTYITVYIKLILSTQLRRVTKLANGWRSGTTVGRPTCDQEVMGSIPGQALLRNDCGQVVHTHVPPSPSSII